MPVFCYEEGYNVTEKALMAVDYLAFLSMMMWTISNKSQTAM